MHCSKSSVDSESSIIENDPNDVYIAGVSGYYDVTAKYWKIGVQKVAIIHKQPQCHMEQKPIPSQAFPLPGRHGHSSVVFNNKIWVIGGVPGKDDVLYYE